MLDPAMLDSPTNGHTATAYSQPPVRKCEAYARWVNLGHIESAGLLTELIIEVRSLPLLTISLSSPPKG
jgi:hypothetical protein